MALKFGASLTDDTSSVNYDRNMFIIQATDRRSQVHRAGKNVEFSFDKLKFAKSLCQTLSSDFLNSENVAYHF